MIVLATIDLIWGLLILVYQIRSVIREGRIRIFHFSNLMFAFVYGFLPSIILCRTSLNISTTKIDASPRGIAYLSLATLLSIIVHFCLNIAYKGTRAKRKLTQVRDDTALTSGLVMLVLGWISLFLWTRADGGIMNFISHADGIRAGYYHLNNPFAFLEHVTRILMFAGTLVFSAWMQQKDIKGKVKMFIPALAGIIGGFLFISAWDSRTAFGFFVLMNILVHIEYRISIKKRLIKAEIIKLAVILVGVLLLMVASQSIMNAFRNKAYVSIGSSMNLFDIVEKEFGYIIRTQQAVIGDFLTGTKINLQFGNDLINAITAWIPSRFIPFDVPPSLWQYNTLLVSGSLTHGTVPSDLMSSSMSDLWVLGIIIIPLFYGSLIKRIDVLLCSNNYCLYNSVLKCVFCTVATQQISHFSIATIVSGSFYIVLGHIVTILVRKTKVRK